MNTKLFFLFLLLSLTVKPLLAQQTAKEFFDKGNDEYWSGHYNNALTAYNKAITLDSTHATYYLSRGKVYFHIQKYDKALLDFNSCLARNPYNAEAYEMRSRTKYQMKDYDGAVRDQDIFKDLQKPKGTQSVLAWDYVKKGDPLRAGLSWVRQMKGNYTHKYDLEAIKKWCDDQQAKGDTGNIDVRIFAYEVEGLVQIQRKMPDKAQDAFEMAHKILIDAPDSSLYLSTYVEELDYSLYYKYAELLSKNNKYDQAIALFQAIQQRKPDSWRIDYAISQYQMAKGNNEAVLKSVDAAFSKGMTWAQLNANPNVLQIVQSQPNFADFQKKYPLPQEK
jgi:tetratricopeptide (TPR) repeat protein